MATDDAERLTRMLSMARRFVDRGLRDDNSVLTSGRAIWTRSNADELMQHYVGDLDAGGRTFFDKLTDQLAPVTDGAKQLMAELLYLNMLPLGDFRATTKKANVERVLGMMATPVALSPSLVDALDAGAFAGGVAFKTSRWAQLAFLVEFVHRWKGLDTTRKDHLLAEPYKFRDEVQAVPTQRAASQRAALAYLFFPETFEPIVSTDHKRRIQAAFAPEIGGKGEDVDRDLAAIREALSATTEARIDFYRPPWVERWRPPEPPPSPRRAWFVPSREGDELVGRWVDEGWVSQPATHLEGLDTSADRDEVQAAVGKGFGAELSPHARAANPDEVEASLSRMQQDDFHLVELDPPRDVALPDHVGVALGENSIATAVPTRRPGWWRVSDVRRVGVVTLDGFEVRIAPKMPVPRLFFLLGYARDPRFWRDQPAGFETVDDLAPAVAHGFVRRGESALRRGVLRGYIEREDSLTALRGRVRTADQVARRHGLPLPLEVRYDEFVDDIAENRILRTAAQVLAGLPGMPRDLTRRLRRLAGRLAEARLISRREPRPTWTPSRLNARYTPALRLAELVLDAASIEHGEGAVRCSGLLVEPWRVFEDFVGVALREALAPYGGSLDLQSTRDHLDTAGRVLLRPDMVWRRGGRTVAVLDAKYKVAGERGVPDSDLYQLLAYCTALGVPRGHLLYARGLGPTHTHNVRRVGTQLSCHALDLDQEPQALLADMARFAAELEAGVDDEPTAGLEPEPRYSARGAPTI